MNTKECIRDAFNWTCPYCDTEFSEGDMMDVCHEPFNGATVLCENCQNNYQVDLLFKIQKL